MPLKVLSNRRRRLIWTCISYRIRLIYLMRNQYRPKSVRIVAKQKAISCSWRVCNPVGQLLHQGSHRVLRTLKTLKKMMIRTRLNKMSLKRKFTFPNPKCNKCRKIKLKIESLPFNRQLKVLTKLLILNRVTLGMSHKTWIVWQLVKESLQLIQAS